MPSSAIKASFHAAGLQAPPWNPPSAPHFDGAKHTSVWSDDFESYTAGNRPSGNYAGLGTPGSGHLKFGDVVIDGAVSHGGTKSCKMVVNVGSCQGSDADVGLERNCATLDSNWNSTQRVWYMEAWHKFDVGYYDLNCGGEFKEFLNFRLPAGDPTGRLDLLATKNGGPLVCPDFYGGAVVPVGTIGWSAVTHSETGSTKPVACASGKEYMRQELATGTKRPIDIDDGNFHNICLMMVRESAVDAGDGFYGVWVDDVQAVLYDGLDTTRAEYLQVYTRSTPFMRPFQIACIVNLALSAVGNRWIDDLNIYRNTN